MNAVMLFFSYLFSVDLTDYHDQDFPVTQGKNDAIVKRLDNVSKFIKERYVLKYKNFMLNLKEAHDEYISFCQMNSSKQLCKIDFNKKLDALNIKSYKSGNEHNKFNITHEKLVEIAKKNKWMHETDDFEIKIDPFKEDPVDKGIQRDIEDKDAEIKALREQIEILNNKAKIVEVIVERCPWEIIHEQLLKDQQEVMDMMAMRKPKLKQDDKARKISFDLFLNELDDLL